MRRAPAKARASATARSPPRKAVGSLREEFEEVLVDLAELSEESPEVCDQCKTRCDKGTFVALVRVEDGELQEATILCSGDCFLDFTEEELVDDRVERATRDERTFLHSKICPACKLRVRRGVEEGEFEDAG